jgi:hypothetical protein
MRPPGGHLRVRPQLLLQRQVCLQPLDLPLRVYQLCLGLLHRLLQPVLLLPQRLHLALLALEQRLELLAGKACAAAVSAAPRQQIRSASVAEATAARGRRGTQARGGAGGAHQHGLVGAGQLLLHSQQLLLGGGQLLLGQRQLCLEVRGGALVPGGAAGRHPAGQLSRADERLALALGLSAALHCRAAT